MTMTEVNDRDEIQSALNELARRKPNVFACEACDGTGYVLNGRGCGRLPCPRCGGQGGY